MRAISAKVATLTEGMLKAMLLAKLKTASVALLVVVFVIGAGLLSVSALRSSPPAAEDKKPEATEADTPKKEVVASIPVNAGEIIEVYNYNEALGDEKFTEKRLQVTGVMERVSRFGHNYVLTLQGYVPLWFEFDTKARKQLAALEYRSEVTILCQCNGKTSVKMDGKAARVILFRSCEIVQTKPDRGSKKRPK